MFGGVNMRREEIIEEVKDLFESTSNEEWVDASRIKQLMNAIVVGYSIAFEKALGAGLTAMGQLLISEVGDVLSEMVDQLLGAEQLEYSDENRTEIIKSALVKLGIARTVEVESNNDRHRIFISDSIFHPVHAILAKKGYSEFPLSPEGFLCAAIVRKVLREANSNKQVQITTKLPTDGKTLSVEIKEIKRA